MESEIIAVQFLGKALIILALGLILCLLAFIGHNIYIKYQDKYKKIEVSAEKTNSKNDMQE